MISSQSVSLLAILASSLTLTCLSLIKSTSLSNSCHFHIRDIRRIRHFLYLSTVTALANSLVSSKLDYCNSSISQSDPNKLERIQNSVARVSINTSKYQHITPTLKKLHWLPMRCCESSRFINRHRVRPSQIGSSRVSIAARQCSECALQVSKAR